jgi:DNA-binding NarL/FixJ family response regulator
MSTPSIHILVVDDQPELLQEVLPAYGYQVTVAIDGQQALEQLAQPGAGFDLMLLDVMMPVLNGWDVLRQLRSRPAFKHLPVILLTALDDEVDQVSGLKIGADDYIVKPFKIPNLLARIEAVLRRTRRSPGAKPYATSGRAGGGSTGENPGGGEGQSIQPLTDREREILGLVAEGMSNKAIAEHLVVSELTIKTHLKNIFKKLSVSSRTQAIHVGMQHHLIATLGTD